MKVLFIGIIDESVRHFLKLQINALRHLGFEIVILGGDRSENKNLRFTRRPAIFKDTRAIYYIRNYIKNEGFDIVVSLGPKTGLLIALISLSLDFIFVHNFTGQVWVNYGGIKRRIFMLIDAFILRSSRCCLVDGVGQKEFLVKELGGFSDFLAVTNNGSISGVEDKFLSMSYNGAKKSKLVIGYLGRISKDKGFDDYLAVANDLREICCFYVKGINEEDYSIPEFIIYEKESSNVLDFFEKIDIFLFPSYREGFGMAALEASACGIPVVCYDIYGLHNTILHNETGFKVKQTGDYQGLKNALLNYINNRALLKQHSLAAKKYVKQKFAQEDLYNFYYGFFASLISSIKNKI